jgi:hypothetical protein
MAETMMDGPSPLDVANQALAGPAADAIPEETKALVKEWQQRVKDSRKHFDKAFKKMREDMGIVRKGTSKAGWAESKKAVTNIIQRHIRQRVASLYAKNPKVVAKPRPRLYYAAWDGSPEAIQMATQDIMLAAQSGGTRLPNPKSMEIMEDFQRGYGMQEQITKIGKTLENVYGYYWTEQTPSMKRQMKSLVRRTCTTGIGYVKIGFQREMARTPEWQRQMDDQAAQLAHIEQLHREITDPQNTVDPSMDARVAEIRAAMAALEQEPYAIVREGLVFSFPSSTSIIPDMNTKRLEGWLGGRWLAEEMWMTPAEVEKIYKVKLEDRDFTHYDVKHEQQQSSGAAWKDNTDASRKLVCVWEVYDRATGTQFTIADGYCGWLDDPSTPSVRVEQFFPVFALSFNETESEEDLFPISDVQLLTGLQDDYNDARQGLREHRRAARPKTIGPKGRLSDEDVKRLGAAEPHHHIELEGLAGGEKAADLFQAVPYPGVDQNLYETGSIMNDVLLTVGAQEAQMGATSGATATEVATAEGARSMEVSSSVDDLDDFLTELARAGGQVLLLEMSKEKVVEIVGPGAVWPDMTREQIASEVFLEIQAGSSGRPNKAVEIQNMQQLAPLLMQIPGVSPRWLAEEMIRRLDDRLDLSQAFVAGMASIAAMNQQAGSAQANGVAAEPGAAPEAQGNEGANTQPRPDKEQPGSTAPMGNNNLRAA